MFGLAFLAPLMGMITPLLGQLSGVGPLFAQAGPAFQTAGQWALKNWRYVTIGALLVVLAVQHSCYTQVEHKLTAEKAAHAQDVATAKANDLKAKAAVAAANASIEAVRVQGLRDTAVAEQAAREAQARAVAASKTAASIMARKPDNGGICPSIHSLRVETSR